VSTRVQVPLQEAASVRDRSYRPRPMTGTGLIDRLLGGIDLVIDLATLGEFGLEQVPADGHGCELIGPAAGWEALAPARRPGCDGVAALSGVARAGRS
jgi:hypothetical protein